MVYSHSETSENPAKKFECNLSAKRSTLKHFTSKTSPTTVYTVQTELWEMGTRLLYKWQRKLSNRQSYQLSSIVTI
jgi:hypothetical protein